MQHAFRDNFPLNLFTKRATPKVNVDCDILVLLSLCWRVQCSFTCRTRIYNSSDKPCVLTSFIFEDASYLSRRRKLRDSILHTQFPRKLWLFQACVSLSSLCLQKLHTQDSEAPTHLPAADGSVVLLFRLKLYPIPFPPNQFRYPTINGNLLARKRSLCGSGMSAPITEVRIHMGIKHLNHISLSF